jgi:hypothetical protein
MGFRHSRIGKFTPIKESHRNMTHDAAPQPTLRPWRFLGWWFAGLLFLGIVVTIVAGGAVSYRARRQAALVAALQRNGASVFHAAKSWNLSERQAGAPPPATYVPEWLRKRLGDDFFDVVDSVYAARYVS